MNVTGTTLVNSRGRETQAIPTLLVDYTRCGGIYIVFNLKKHLELRVLQRISCVRLRVIGRTIAITAQ